MGKKEKDTMVPVTSGIAFIFAGLSFLASILMAAFDGNSTLAIIFAIFGGSLLVTGAVFGLQKEEIEFRRKRVVKYKNETTET